MKMKMRKNIVTELYKNAWYWIVWVAFLACIIASATLIYDHYYASHIARLPRLRYTVFVGRGARVMMFGSVLLTAYLSTADFSERTVQNILSTGVSRKGYFFSKAIMIGMYTLLLYAAGWIAYGVAYTVQQKRFEIAVTPGEIAVLFIVAVLQLWVYCSMVNLIGFISGSQFITMVSGFGWLVLELLTRGVLDLTGSVDSSALRMFPINVLEQSSGKVVLGELYDVSFWISGVYALGFIIVLNVACCLYFDRKDIH